MRRFIEEIQVRDPMIANKIIAALEAKPDDEKDPVYKREPRNNYEVEMYEHHRVWDPCKNKSDDYPYISLKIFVREDVK